MSSMLEQLWPVFLAETSEQLESLEAALDRHGRKNIVPDIDNLFREFHTLKSSFSMVDLRLLVDVAHACEDVLHGLRRSETPVNNTIKQLLLETVDWLKQQLEQASPGNYPSIGNEELLGRLAPYRPPDENSVPSAPEDGPSTSHPIPEPEPPTPKVASLLDEERESLAISTLRISSQRLDELVNHVSLIAKHEATLSHIITDNERGAALEQGKQLLNSAGVNSDREALRQLLRDFNIYRQQLLEAESAIQGAISSIQQTVLDLRIIPLSTVFNRLPRIVRKRAGELGKTIQLVLEGGDLSIDKGMIDEITEPLVHILQNAIDHGIETAEERQALAKPATATLSIHATEQGGLLRIDIRDDGKGIDYRDVRERAISKGIVRDQDALHASGQWEKSAFWLALLFTREYHQTDGQDQDDNVSGLDRVRSRLSAIGGSMEFTSEPGTGTRMSMCIPVTVAIQSVMLVRAAEQVLAIPTRNIQEICSVTPTDLTLAQGQSFFPLRNNPLPVYHVNHLLQIDTPSTISPANDSCLADDSRLELLILHHDIHCIALAVDAVLERQEVFVRDIHPDLRTIPGIGGVSLLGNGQVVVILDPENLLTIARQKPHNVQERFRKGQGAYIANEGTSHG